MPAAVAAIAAIARRKFLLVAIPCRDPGWRWLPAFQRWDRQHRPVRFQRQNRTGRGGLASAIANPQDKLLLLKPVSDFMATLALAAM